MYYLGTAPTIDNKSITDSVAAGFERALSEALIPDPTSGEMVFDEEKIDKILEEKRNYLPDQPQALPMPTSQGVIDERTEIARKQAALEQARWKRDLYPQPENTEERWREGSSKPETSSGGGAFPLLALGLVAYLSSQ
jgi:hypothetical protein